MSKLVILDIDGLLVERTRKEDDFEEMFAKLSLDEGQVHELTRYWIRVRPGIDKFLKELFEKYRVSFWTSSTYKNANEVLGKILTDKQRKNLVFFWCRDRVDLDPDYGQDGISDHDTVKKLEHVFSHPYVNMKREWTPDNTLVIDDEARKLRFNPEQTRHVISDFDAPISTFWDHPFFN